MSRPAITLDSFTTFGGLLKYLRSRAQLTQLDLSIAVGYSEAQISRLENGQRPPEPARLAALFVPALHLENEPEVVSRLIELASLARGAHAGPAQQGKPLQSTPLSWRVAARSNLPAGLTSFIGREQEISAVCQRVLNCRLVTLTGAGGVGKTRLALRAAEELQEYFPDGVWLVELASLTDPALVLAAVAECLEVRRQPKQDLLPALIGFLKIGTLLLVLDNCEHVIDEAAGLVSQLLRNCPELHILATSREILRLEGEEAVRCPSLSLPDAWWVGYHPVENPQQHSLDELARSEAVRLFIERVRSIWPEMALTEANARPIAQICRRLDGIPLAIELAAARTRMLSVEQIADHLDHVFRLLSYGSRSELPRHQTLKALIDWSYNLLAPEERALFARLAIFAGGWTLAAAEKICADEFTRGLPPDRLQMGQILNILGELVDKSLIQFDLAPVEGPRYRMLETVRQYGYEQLVENGEEKLMRERHLDHFLSFALKAEPQLRAPGARVWLDRLEQELDNLRLALDWSLAGQQPDGKIEKGLRLAAALHWFWWERNHGTEGAQWLERLLHEQKVQIESQKQAGEPVWSGMLDQDRQAARGRALNVLGWIDFFPPETFHAFPTQPEQKRKALAQESQAIFQSLCDGLGSEAGKGYRRELALSRFIQVDTVEDVLACREQFRGLHEAFWAAECDAFLTDYFLYFGKQKVDEKAAKWAEESLDLHKEVGDQYGVGDALFALSNFALINEDEDRAIDLALEGIRCLEAVGNQDRVTLFRTSYIMFLIESGDYPEAARQLEDVLRVAAEYNNRFLYLEHQRLWAFLAWNMGQDALAAQYGEEVLQYRENLPINLALRVIYFFIRVCVSQGKTALAKTYLREYFQQANHPWATFKAIQVLGILAAREGQVQLAARLFGAQDLLWEQGGRRWYKLSPRERSENEPALAAAREALGEAGFAAAWEAGREMGVEQICQFAREFAISLV